MADAIQTLIAELAQYTESAKAQPVRATHANVIAAWQETEAAIAPVTGNQSAGTVYAGPASGAPGVPAFRPLVSADVAPAVGGMLSGKNRAINGNMQVQQYPVGTITPSSQYVIDRWGSYNTQALLHFAQNLNAVATPPGGSPYYAGFQAPSTLAVGASDYSVFQHIIEAFNFGDLNFGTAAAENISLSFWVAASAAGTYGGGLSNAAGNRSITFSYNIAAAATWQKIVLTLPGDVAGTWTNQGVGACIKLFFALAAGASLQAPAGIWTGANNFCPPGCVNLWSTAGAYWYITDVQLEIAPPGATPAAPLATTFDRRQFGTELALCQRYFVALVEQGNARLAMGQAISATAVDAAVLALPVTMRVPPTVVLPGTVSAAGQALFLLPPGTLPATPGALAVSGSPDVNSIAIGVSGAAGYTAGNASAFYTSLGCTITANAEL